jgi:hypothetical protein
MAEPLYAGTVTDMPDDMKINVLRGLFDDNCRNFPTDLIRRIESGVTSEEDRKDVAVRSAIELWNQYLTLTSGVIVSQSGGVTHLPS